MKHEINRAELEGLIDLWIVGRKAERNRKIIKRKLIDGLTFEELAEEVDLSVNQVKNIVYKADQILVRHI